MLTPTAAMRMLESAMLLVPAYGKTYATREEMLADWHGGRDFRIKGGPYCSIRNVDDLKQNCSTLWIVDLITKVTVNLG